MPARSRAPTLRSRPVTATGTRSRSPTRSETSRAPPPRPQRSTTAPRLSVGTPTALTGAGNQYYDAGTKTLFFRSTGSGSFDLNATASDSDTAVDTVDFPTISSLSGWSGSTGGADATSPYSSPAHYSWSSGASGPACGPISATDKAANSVFGHDHDRRRHRSADWPVDHAHRRACALLRLELGRLQPAQRFRTTAAAPGSTSPRPR